MWSESELDIQVSNLAHSNTNTYDGAASLIYNILLITTENNFTSLQRQTKKKKNYFQYHTYTVMCVEFAPFKICFNDYIHANTVEIIVMIYDSNFS